MFSRQGNQACQSSSFSTRVKAGGTQTAQGVSSAATSAATGISKGVKQGVYGVRVWAAPQLESAADWHTNTFAPAVSTALRGSAQQIRPADLTQKNPRGMLTWSILGAAVLATGGAVAALVKYRYRAAMETTDEGFEDSAAGTAPAGAEGAPVQGVPSTSGAPGAPGTPVAPGTSGVPADSTTNSADIEVNGRVSASGW